jgi:DNA-binding SARP family transcriptional activator
VATRATPRLSLTLLGGFRAQLGAGPPLALTSKKAQALLAYLSVRQGARHTRDGVGALLWGSTDDGQARQSLRQALAAVRRALPRGKPPVLVTSNETVALNDAAVDIDVRRFEQLASNGDARALAQALALFSGDLLEGFRLREPRFDDWLHAERERLRGHAARALERLSTRPVASEALEAAARAALRLLALDPLHESVHRSLMRLYLHSGRRAAALRQYQVCVDALQRELDAAPEPATKALYQQALAQGAPPAAPAPAADLPVAETGRFVGRQRELTRLQQAFEAARAGRGRLVTILGEAGIGKTRLIQELAARIARQGGRAIVGRCFESEEVLPFAPWIDMLRGEAARAALAEVVRTHPRHRAQLARLLPELDQGRAGIPAPAEDHRRIFEAVAQVVATAAARPIAIILDDLHWADDMSVRLLAFLARRRRLGRLLLVTSAREEELLDRPLTRRLLDEAEGTSSAGRISMPPLSEAETLALVQLLAAAPARPDTERIARRVWRLSEGNPFMAVETMRALRDGAAPESPDRLPLSERIQQTVLRRLERLDRRAQALVAVAAVIGREFDYALLRRAAGVSERAAADGVEELVRRRVLQSAGERLAFAHDYIREVAYARLLPPRRRLLHGAVARALADAHAPSLDPHAAALGRHYLAAGLPAEAVGHLRRAATVASARGAHTEAIAHLQQTLAVLESLPTQRSLQEQAIDVRFDLSNCFNALGQFERQGEWARAAAHAAEALGDSHRLAWASSYLGYYHWVMGRSRQACTYAEQARAAGEAYGDVPLIVSATKQLGLAITMLGRHDEARAHFERCIALLTGDLIRHPCGLQIFPAVTARAWLALSLAERGEFDRAAAAAADALRLADELDHSFTGSIAYWCVGRAYQLKGADEEATRFLERSLAITREGNIAIMMPLVNLTLGVQHAEAGRVAEGLALVQKNLDLFEPGNALQPFALRALGQVYLRAGRRDDARSTWVEAIAVSRQCEQRGSEAGVHFLLGSLGADGDAAEQSGAAEHYRRALALGEELDDRPLQARCHQALGQLLGDDSHLAAAATLSREIGLV